jgi:hypothetical protein
LNGVKIKDALGLGLVAGGHVVAGQAEHILHPHCRRAQNIALNGNAIAVAATYLQDSFIAGPSQQSTAAHTAHMAVGPGTIGGINGVTHFGQHQGIFVNIVGIGAIRGVKFGRNGKTARTEDPLQAAFGA